MLSGTFVVSVVLSIFVLWYTYRVLHSIYFSPLKDIPSPLVFQLFPFYLDYYIAAGTSPFMLHHYHKKNGTVFRVGWNRVIFVDPYAPSKIYGSYHLVKGRVYDGFKYFGDNINTQRDNLVHKRKRKLVGSAFTKSKIISMAPIMVKEGIEPLLSNLEKSVSSKMTPTSSHKVVNLFTQFHLMAWDIIGELAFGRSFGMLKSPKNHVAVSWLDSVLNFSLICYAFPFLTGLRIKSGERLRSFTKELIDQYTSSSDPIGADKDHRLISSFITARDKVSGDELSMENIFAEAHLLLFGGTDTSSSALTFLIHQILSHKQAYNKILEELDGVNDLGPTVKLPYLEATIKETLRLFPPVSNLLFREVPNNLGQTDYDISGYNLPPGTEVAVNIYSIHRSELFWTKGDQFFPERWLENVKDDSYPQLLAPLCYLPFLLGPRSCVGKEMAMMEIKLTAAHILKKFHLELHDKDAELNLVAKPITRPNSSKLLVRIYHRQGS